jgi:hypothetical protein
MTPGIQVNLSNQNSPRVLTNVTISEDRDARVLPVPGPGHLASSNGYRRTGSEKPEHSPPRLQIRLPLLQVVGGHSGRVRLARVLNSDTATRVADGGDAQQ